GFALMKLADIERDMRVEATENMLWVIHQAQTSALRLDAASAQSVSGIGAADLKLRYNVLLSRLELLSDGPQARYLATLGLGLPFAELVQPVFALEPIIDAAEGGDHRAASRIHDALSPLNAFLGRAANAAMVAQW